MARHIGIVACSAEGAALCYRTLCAEAPAVMGEHMHPEVSMHTHPLGEYMVHIRSGNWPGVAGLMLSSARNLEKAGAEFAICPDNTIHQAFGLVAAASPIPWIHIADAVADEARSRGFRTLAITGTKYLMTGPVYADCLRQHGHRLPHTRRGATRGNRQDHLFGTGERRLHGVVQALLQRRHPDDEGSGMRRGRPRDAPRSRSWWTPAIVPCRRWIPRGCSREPRCRKPWQRARYRPRAADD